MMRTSATFIGMIRDTEGEMCAAINEIYLYRRKDLEEILQDMENDNLDPQEMSPFHEALGALNHEDAVASKT